VDKGRGGEIPEKVSQHPMDAVHIIPFYLNNFDDRVISDPAIVRDVLSFSPLTHLRRQRDASRTWHMLESWTQIDFMALVGPNINSPRNAIYMTETEHLNFENFEFYLDKGAVSHFRGDSCR
jgi:hypothetical protein